MVHRLAWFRNRIGKKIKRVTPHPIFEVLQVIVELEIIDLYHAKWLFTAQTEYGFRYY